MRKPLVIANWKMNGSRLTLAALVSALKPLAAMTATLDVALCPPFVYLPQLAEQLAGSGVGLGAQDISAELPGAHTGDIAGEMLKDFGCRFALAGHSERRAAHGETDTQVGHKARRARDCGITPVICVGETLAERESGGTLEVVGAQLATAISFLSGNEEFVIAYEPVWAIGTGQTATAKQAQEVHRFIRQQLGAAGEATRVIYGGSVKAENARTLFAKGDIDGFLVGGASLKADEFLAICRATAS